MGPFLSPRQPDTVVLTFRPLDTNLVTTPKRNALAALVLPPKLFFSFVTITSNIGAVLERSVAFFCPCRHCLCVAKRFRRVNVVNLSTVLQGRASLSSRSTVQSCLQVCLLPRTRSAEQPSWSYTFLAGAYSAYVSPLASFIYSN